MKREKLYILRWLAFGIIVYHLMLTTAFTRSMGLTTTPPPPSPPTPTIQTVFSRIWTAPSSAYEQSLQYANWVIQLKNGMIVAGGGDATQENGCPPYYGGAWLVAVPPSGNGGWQKLYSTCANESQVTNAASATEDGGLVMTGWDLSNPACTYSCAVLAKLTNGGTVSWAEELINVYTATISDIQQTPDEGYVAVGQITPISSVSLNANALLAKFSSTGVLQWAFNFGETEDSFPGALSGGDANLSFDSVTQAPDNGYIISGVAEADFATGYANLLVVVKVDENGNEQWERVYYNDIWGGVAAGVSRYPIFSNSNGDIFVAGTVQTLSYPFARNFLLMKLDSEGNVLWDDGYGGDAGTELDVNVATSATETSGEGFVIAGTSNAFSGPMSYFSAWVAGIDDSGDLDWQKMYTGQPGQQGQQFNGIVQTSDGGFAAAGTSDEGNSAYGGPGLFLDKMDESGNIGTCSCVQDTSVTPQPLDLVSYDASFTQTTPQNMSLVPLSLITKATSVQPIDLY